MIGFCNFQCCRAKVEQKKITIRKFMIRFETNCTSKYVNKISPCDNQSRTTSVIVLNFADFKSNYP